MNTYNPSTIIIIRNPSITEITACFCPGPALTLIKLPGHLAGDILRALPWLGDNMNWRAYLVLNYLRLSFCLADGAGCVLTGTLCG
jgi:hypothetical protein